MKVSPSKLNTFLHCPQTYMLEYLQEERPPQQPFLPADFGVFVHKVLELAINEPEEDAHDILAREFVKVFGAEVYHSVLDYAYEYQKAIKDTIKYGKTIGKDYKAPEMTGYFKRTYGNQLVNLFNAVLGHDEVNAYAFWDDAYRCVSNFEEWYKGYDGELSMSEHKLNNVVLADVGEYVYFNGIIDFINKGDDDFIIVDFKTNRTPYDESFTSFSTQLGMYAVAGRKAFGKLPTVGYLELRTGKFTVKQISQEDLDRYEDYFFEVYKEMSNFEIDYKNHKKAGGDDYDFLINYSHRFPVGALQVQGCPCKFIDSCIFKSIK